MLKVSEGSNITIEIENEIVPFRAVHRISTVTEQCRVKERRVMKSCKGDSRVSDCLLY